MNCVQRKLAGEEAAGKFRLRRVRCADGEEELSGIKGEVGAKSETCVFLVEAAKIGEKRAWKKLDIDEAVPKY